MPPSYCLSVETGNTENVVQTGIPGMHLYPEQSRFHSPDPAAGQPGKPTGLSEYLVMDRDHELRI